MCVQIPWKLHQTCNVQYSFQAQQPCIISTKPDVNPAFNKLWQARPLVPDHSIQAIIYNKMFSSNPILSTLSVDDDVWQKLQGKMYDNWQVDYWLLIIYTTGKEITMFQVGKAVIQRQSSETRRQSLLSVWLCKPKLNKLGFICYPNSRFQTFTYFDMVIGARIRSIT